MRFLVLNGPNLNLLGQREPDTYGSETLDALASSMNSEFSAHELTFRQSNVEGELINVLHGADGNFDGVVFNPGGYTHTSVAIRDAVSSIQTPVVEVHISNVARREAFRHDSLIAPVCVGHIAGFGTNGYRLAVQALERHLTNVGA
jgi:3-dehydroquinate dehydratase-2